MTAAALATTVPAAGAAAPADADAPVRARRAAQPDLGPNVRVFDPRTPAEEIQAALDAAAEQAGAEFGTGRYAFLFKPGSYDVDVRLGCYTSVAGLGTHPDDVTVNGAVRAAGRDRPGDGDEAPANPWRSAENLAVVPAGGDHLWAASQGAPLRRVHVRGRLCLSPGEGGRDGAGFVADSVVDGPVVDAAGQRWLFRDSSVANWSTTAAGQPDATVGQVFAGVEEAPARSLPAPPCGTLPTSPLSREKPFLYVDGAGAYRVFLPAPHRDGVGPTWAAGPPEGTSVPLERFFVARPEDSARAVNRALAQGRHLLLTPGVYRLADTIRVKWAGTVVLGLGYATLVPQDGVVAMTVADARGVRIAGLLFDAGPCGSRALLEVGDRCGGRVDPREPASVQDVFFRMGGADAGLTAAALVVNSDNVLLDHVRAWRADRGARAGRAVGTAADGVVVHGAGVLATGLSAEHFQQHDVVGNGESGRTVVFRNEPPCDPPDRAAYRRPDGTAGWTVGALGADARHHEA
ncbi:hypothetical protein [Actinacidiphila yeochonensis]|uniref:hypothetical protein n=1 Tax=Actinacidiphila yeochonensis TaxID=89050 RepID=UPI00068F246D|nr:hypothetical protein [Actinacidiphila yeochonensis]